MMACMSSVGDALNLGIVKRREPLVEGREDCDYPIQLNMTKDNSRRKSGTHAQGPDISDEDFRWISVERIQPDCRSDQGCHDDDRVLWRATDEQNHEHSGRDDCDLSALEPVVACAHVHCVCDYRDSGRNEKQPVYEIPRPNERDRMPEGERDLRAKMYQHQRQGRESDANNLHSLGNVRDIVNEANHCRDEEHANRREVRWFGDVPDDLLNADDDAQRDREAEQSRDSAKFRNFVFCGFVDIPSNHSTLAHFSEEAGDCDYDDREGKAERGRRCEEEGSVYGPCWGEKRSDRHSEARSPSPELKGLRPCSQNRKTAWNLTAARR